MAHKLLVADSSLTIQKVIRLALSNEGYDIQAVSDGREALEQIALFRPDIVLIDASLPQKSAFEVKAECGRPETRFVLMASAFDPVDEDRVKASGFDGRLVKPFDPAHLRQVLADVAKLRKRGADIFSTTLAPPAVEAPQKHPSADALWENKTEPEFEWAVDERHAADANPPAPQFQSGEKTFTDLWSSESGPASEALTGMSAEPSIEPPSRTFLDEASVAPPPLSEQKLEALLMKHFQKTLEELAREKIPEIAERVIRQEIGRLLANPPSQP